MELIEARTLAESLLVQHNLKDWKFVFTQAKFWFGQCDYKNKTIELSQLLTELNPEEHVRDTILHEIAHALVPANVHHGKVWKDMAEKIGARPKRCYSQEVIRPKALYTTHCKNCGKETQSNRKPRRGRKIACGNCCKLYNRGHFTKRFALKFTRN
jgi:predicted SprT family Zn-dependent metalloprotease